MHLFSCNKNNADGIDKTFNLTINGTSFNAGEAAYAQGINAFPTTVVHGQVDRNSTIHFSLMNCDTAGTYIARLLTVQPNSAYVWFENNGVVYESDYCKDREQVIINVTSLTSSMIKGNFAGSLRSSDSALININGAFSFELRP